MRIKTTVLAILLIAISVGVTLTLTADAQSSKKVKWKEIDAGSIPSTFGDLAGFTGTTNNYALMFKDDDGNLRIVEYRGSKINPRAVKVGRSYDN